MRALTLQNGQVHYTDHHPDPPNLPGEARIRVMAAGICSTDLHLIRGYMGFQGVLGHEFVGIVEEAPDHPGLTGRRVVGEINASCHTCPTCLSGNPTHCPHRTTLGIQGRDGAFADYLTLPLTNIHMVPDSLSNEDAVFVEPLAAACEITQRLHVHPTDSVVVIGDGKLGLLCAQVLQLTGCRLFVLGRHKQKLDCLATRGIYVTTEPDSLPGQADIVVEATGTPTGLHLAAARVRPRGTLVVKSTYHGDISFNMTDMVIREITIMGSRCGPFPPALDLLDRQLVDVGPLIEATYGLEQGVEALNRAGTQGVKKVLFKMS